MFIIAMATSYCTFYLLREIREGIYGSGNRSLGEGLVRFSEAKKKIEVHIRKPT